MNIEKIMEKLEKDHIWADNEKEVPELASCPFCGGEAKLVISNPIYGASGAAVRCCDCQMRGPNASIHAMIFKSNGVLCTPMIPESLEHGIMAAVDAWNSRAADRSRLKNLLVREEATA